MDADGSGQRRLTRTPDDEFFLAWSPDGESIAYGTDPRSLAAIWVTDADGSGRRSLGASLIERLTGRVYDEEPAWSPDGERIAFTSDGTEGRGEIYAMNADGSGLTKLTDDPAAEDFYPAWRP